MPPPPLSTRPHHVQALIRRLNTPQKVQSWFRSLHYNTDETMYGLPMVVRRGRAHCLEGALSAAAILEHYGFPPLILDLESEDLLDHTLFIFQRNGKWGAVGKSRDIGLDGRKPVYKTVEALARSYVIPYIDAKAHITSYGVLDLRTLKNSSWRTSHRNVWYVEDTLRHIKHRKIFTSKTVVQRWRQRFIEFKKAHPHQQPDYYPHQESWI